MYYMKEVDDTPTWSQIWDVETKVKALSWLIEAQDADCPQHLPWDQQNVNCGLGRLLWELGDQLATLRRELESCDVKKHQKKKSKTKKAKSAKKTKTRKR